MYKIITDGTAINTRVMDAETDEVVPYVTAIRLNIDRNDPNGGLLEVVTNKCLFQDDPPKDQYDISPTTEDWVNEHLNKTVGGGRFPETKWLAVDRINDPKCTDPDVLEHREVLKQRRAETEKEKEERMASLFYKTEDVEKCVEPAPLTLEDYRRNDEDLRKRIIESEHHLEYLRKCLKENVSEGDKCLNRSIRTYRKEHYVSAENLAQDPSQHFKNFPFKK